MAAGTGEQMDVSTFGDSEGKAEKVSKKPGTVDKNANNLLTAEQMKSVAHKCGRAGMSVGTVIYEKSDTECKYMVLSMDDISTVLRAIGFDPEQSAEEETVATSDILESYSFELAPLPQAPYGKSWRQIGCSLGTRADQTSDVDEAVASERDVDRAIAH